MKTEKVKRTLKKITNLALATIWNKFEVKLLKLLKLKLKYKPEKSSIQIIKEILK